MARLKRQRRAGTAAAVALIALPVILLLFGLVLYIAMGRDTRSEAQNGCDAAALAACRALACDDLHAPHHPDRERDRLRHAGEAARELAEANHAHGHRLSLHCDLDHPEHSEVVFGRLAHPRGTFVPRGHEHDEDREHPINAVRIVVTTTKVRGPFESLFCGRPMQARATAMLDWCAVGFRPKGDECVPLVPIGCYTDHKGDRDDDGWDRCRRTGTDRWRYDPETNRFAPGADGIPELVVVIGGSRGKNEVPGLFLCLGTGSAPEALEQLRSGMTAAQCEKFSGGFHFGEDNTISVSGSRACPAPGTDARRRLIEALEHCAASGQPRIWPLFEKSDGETGMVKVSGWVGARIVSVGSAEGGGVRLVLQPAIVCHPSVVTDPDRPVRPQFWGGPRTVCRARLAD